MGGVPIRVPTHHPSLYTHWLGLAPMSTSSHRGGWENVWHKVSEEQWIGIQGVSSLGAGHVAAQNKSGFC